MPPAARVTDMTSHGTPLTPGPGSLTVMIGFMPAWRALPAGIGGGLEAASQKMDQFMQKPVMTPADATPLLAQISADLVQAGADAAGEGNPAGVGAAAGGTGALNGTNAALTATWTTASAVPGGQPAANTAYTEGIKAAAATAASSLFAAVAGMTDSHICPIPCPIPPHGPGVVTQASESVLIDNLPAVRLGDEVVEACGGSDPIALGCMTVLIGDESPSGGGGGGAAAESSGSDGGSGGEESAAEQAAAEEEAPAEDAQEEQAETEAAGGVSEAPAAEETQVKDFELAFTTEVEEASD